ncbi:MAG: DNA methyltransferase [Gammaproteobacteria bacterium]
MAAMSARPKAQKKNARKGGGGGAEMNVKNRTIFTDKRGFFTAAGKARKREDIRKVVDNLLFLRGMDSECVDLIYLDPPFNSKTKYNEPLGDADGRRAVFNDTWRMDMVKAEWQKKIEILHPSLAKVLDAAGAAGHRSDRPYLIYMAIRLLEMRRVLKPTGGIYLHCDPTMSHWLKLLLDCVFGADNFRNEIVWLRATKPKHSPASFGSFSDHVFFYVKSPGGVFHPQKAGISEADAKDRFREVEGETGRRYYLRSLDIDRRDGRKGRALAVFGKKYEPKNAWQWSQATVNARLEENPRLIVEKNGELFFKQYENGTPVHSVWTDISPESPKRLTGYPTQKPVALLERIILASSNSGDVVLDPFCGCATACIAAEKLGRRWIGMDVSPVAFDMVKKRLVEELQITVKGAKRHGEQEILRLQQERADGSVDKWEAHHRMIPPQRTDGLLLDLKNSKARAEVRDRLYVIQSGHCNGCGQHFNAVNLDIDHITPRAFGGLDVPTNLQLLCGACNSGKATKTMEEYLARRIAQGLPCRKIPESEYREKLHWERDLEEKTEGGLV